MIEKRWKAWGLSADEHDRLRAAGCNICGDVIGKIVLDHNHANGKIRAALCDPCNRGLGAFRDDPQRMRAAADYIEDWQKSHG